MAKRNRRFDGEFDHYPASYHFHDEYRSCGCLKGEPHKRTCEYCPLELPEPANDNLPKIKRKIVMK